MAIHVKNLVVNFSRGPHYFGAGPEKRIKYYFPNICISIASILAASALVAGS